MTFSLKAQRELMRGKGIFHTDNLLARELAKLVPEGVANVYDPTCGTGSLLAEFKDEVEKYGQEIEKHFLDEAGSRLKNFTGVHGDTLMNPAFVNRRFEAIVANPPFSIKWLPRMDERFSRAPCLPPAAKADYAFVLHCLHMLEENGIAVMLVFPGILYRGRSEGEIRRWLVENNHIERVVRFPPKMFTDTSIETACIVIKKRKDSSGIVFEDAVLGEKRDVTLDEIKSNDYNLSVSLYIKKDQPKTEIDPIATEMAARENCINRLRTELKFSKMIEEMEGVSMLPFIQQIESLIKEFTN